MSLQRGNSIMSLVEVCAGSVLDCVTAQEAGAHRIELNSALYLGGLTPSLAMLQLAKANVTLPIICMVRPRGGGFCYHELEKDTLFLDAKALLESGADGLAFGFLTKTQAIDLASTKRMIDLCHQYNKEAVFHRAIDCCHNIVEATQQLIHLGCDRILTSGQRATAQEGVECLAQLHSQFGNQIEWCMASGISSQNVQHLIETTGIQQVHGSFKCWKQDPTTTNGTISYQYSPNGDYEACDIDELERIVNCTT